MRVITASGDDLTEATDKMRIMMRQIAGSFAQYEKARLVRKLREARERSGKLGGRKSYVETKPQTVAGEEIARAGQIMGRDFQGVICSRPRDGPRKAVRSFCGAGHVRVPLGSRITGGHF
jgi:hypothetical protein